MFQFHSMLVYKLETSKRTELIVSIELPALYQRDCDKLSTDLTC